MARGIGSAIIDRAAFASFVCDSPINHREPQMGAVGAIALQPKRSRAP